jgi:hypothetical protein
LVPANSDSPVFAAANTVMIIDQRQFYRRKVSEETPSAVLSFGHSRIQCTVVETSLGGFAVLATEELKSAAGSMARLHAQGLEYIVRITRQESLGDCVLIAMKQIEEVVPNIELMPASPLNVWLTAAAWGVALVIIGVACYVLSESRFGDSIQTLWS